jgi:hypothetical protein
VFFAPLSLGLLAGVEARGDAGEFMRALHLGPKKYVHYRLKNGRVEYLSHAESAMGGFFIDPSGLTGKHPSGHREWSTGIALRAARNFELPGGFLKAAPNWEKEGEESFPALRRLRVVSKTISQQLPKVLRPHPGMRYVQASLPRLSKIYGSSPVTKDPGGDLANWRERTWIDPQTQGEVNVTTGASFALRIQSLEDVATNFEKPSLVARPERVFFDPLLVRRVGASSSMLDAELEGEEDYESQRVTYAEPQYLKHLERQLSLFSPAEISRQTGIPASQIRDAQRKGKMTKRLEGRYLIGVLGRK